jgi:hypothetical protein
MRDRLKASQLLSIYIFLIDFTFEFIRHPISLILSPSTRTFVEITIVTQGTICTRTLPVPLQTTCKVNKFSLCPQPHQVVVRHKVCVSIQN